MWVGELDRISGSEQLHVLRHNSVHPVALFPINFLLFVTLYFQASRKGNWVLKIDSMAKSEFQNSPHVLRTRYIMCWWHLNYILRHSEHLWIFTTSFRKKIREVDLNLDLNQKSWFKTKKSLIWIFLKKKSDFFPTLRAAVADVK